VGAPEADVTVAITGAAGQLGRLTAQRVLERVAPGEVMLVTRRPDAIADLADAGATVRHGDFDEPASLPGAFAGVDRLLLISTDVLGNRVAQHTAAIDAAAAAGVEHVLYTSGLNAGSALPLVVSHDHGATEQAIRARGLRWTALRNGLYAESQVPAAARAVASGHLVHNNGDGATAYVSREDCAAAAAAALTGDGHEDRVYDITGPELVTQAELAAMVSDIAGRRVVAVAIDDDEATRNLTAVGLPADAAMAYASFGTAIREGVLDILSSDVEDLTGRRPRSLRDVLEAHRSELEEAP
jgi:NAD(P)H dehydrogenase (quinone)